MGTVVEISAEGADRDHLVLAVDSAYRAMERLSAMMNHYDPHSVVSAINDAAGVHAVPAPAELREVLAMARSVSERTGGAFDITVGSLKGWRFDPRNPSRPDAAQIERQRPLIDYRDVVVDADKGTVALRRAGQRIDLGGIAKLYILREGMKVLASHGIARALVNGGGDVVARTPDRAWRVGIRDPRRPGELLGALAVTTGYVVSSGDYERFFVEGGKRYHHILDPRTGTPAEGPHHVTLVAERMEDVNGIATAIMVLGVDAGKKLVAATPGLEGLIVDRDYTSWMSPGLTSRLEPVSTRGRGERG
ncbi:MAG: FAD:protein FMN transferase [Burkholderiales bacterium]|nr:FAD:protein FMN transferase [Burkholderiales bacterium]